MLLSGLCFQDLLESNIIIKVNIGVTGALRADGASRFGKDNRWGWFPSVSAGWRLTEEPFMKSLTFITI